MLQFGIDFWGVWSIKGKQLTLNRKCTCVLTKKRDTKSNISVSFIAKLWQKTWVLETDLSGEVSLVIGLHYPLNISIRVFMSGRKLSQTPHHSLLMNIKRDTFLRVKPLLFIPFIVLNSQISWSRCHLFNCAFISLRQACIITLCWPGLDKRGEHDECAMQDNNWRGWGEESNQLLQLCGCWEGTFLGLC